MIVAEVNQSDSSPTDGQVFVDTTDERALLIHETNKSRDSYVNKQKSKHRHLGNLLDFLNIQSVHQSQNSANNPDWPYSKATLKESHHSTRNQSSFFPVKFWYRAERDEVESELNENDDYDHDHDHENDKEHRSSGSSFKRKKLTLLLGFLIFISISLVSFLVLIKLFTLVNDRKLFGERTLSLSDAREDERIDLKQLEVGKRSRWLVSSTKCHIPFIEPWHESIQTYVEVKPKLDCKKVLAENQPKQVALTYVKHNRLYFTREAIESEASKDCCFKSITRSKENDDDLAYNETCNPIVESGIDIPFELIQVECHGRNYTNVHSFVRLPSDEKKAFMRVAAKKLEENHYYNVVMVGVDTISRLNGYRQLNRTLSLLKKNFKTIEFVGYNKVGENTFPNLIPLLSGLRPEQLTETQCWLASNYSQESEKGDDFLDNCKYLWNYYQDLGYLTYFSEDWPKASTFNYLKPGFKREPTSFYGRPFTLARDDFLLPPVKMGCATCLLDKPIVELDLENLKNFIHENRDSPHFAFHWINCPQHDDLNGASRVDYIIERFFRDIQKVTYDDRSFVIFFSDHGYRWNNFVSTRVGHYESSLPLLTIAAPKRFIQEHPKLYKNLQNHRAALLTPFDLFKTLIDIRNLAKKSIAGDRGSSRKPILKKSSLQQVPTTAPHEELEFTSEIDPTASTTVKQLSVIHGLSYKQDFSLLSLIEAHNSTQIDRSCIEAGIPDNYCVCHEFQHVDSGSADVLGAAYYLVYVHLYTKLRNHENICKPLDLDKIKEAEMFDFKQMKSRKNQQKRSISDELEKYKTTTSKPNDSVVLEVVIDEHHYLPNREYSIILSTKPGTGIFQEVVRFYGENMDDCMLEVKRVKLIMEDKSVRDVAIKHANVIKMNQVCKFSVHSESISRLSLYKLESGCVKSNNELNKICYCRNI